MRIDVKTLPVIELIADIAAVVRAELENSNGEYVHNIPANVGEGSVRGTRFDHRMGVINYNCKVYEAG